MSIRKNQQEYEKSRAYRFSRWLKGEKDPFVGVIEMKSQNPDEDPEQFYSQEDYEAIRRHARDYQNNQMIHRYNRVYVVGSIVACLALIVVLIYAISYLPAFGKADSVGTNEVATRYIENGLQETGAVNVVAGMIATYRAFDTFGETTVLFIATCSVMILLMVEREDKRRQLHLDDREFEPVQDEILQHVAKILCPFIFMFGIYIILNGHLSPGGGFSGGAIIGAGMILFSSAYDFPKIQRFFNEHIYVIVKVTALMLYGTIAVYFFYTGANGLESVFPLGTPGAILSGGIILPINIFVGTEVACTIYAFYALFRRGGL
ncbi:hydrogen gas-evolving membrane-bound hydrogenase subunit E [Hespellia stercorisuis]|uniref:Multisubunit sodium/proton antiporter, MrpB subunit (TC 2.A.63.1) n=1 Tax=Hespellia stercorisuis DSM 15480 TaxID=1121950 RepID=A0A1M6HKL2_9FIRM|nr:hydrogen gas-evolving membrane-bound hydrogenase subunit E [Hespellia stercorisuis]SHJ22710.1 multisubunit sodium/proton antiporter, MrpB subunit (TC 2.A.63.1) [Hespellia stercorisuis DSM 15480]